ncbi:hypothetical protein [Paraburkholderia kururiensis]|jgi:hypothetical protein|uniref:Uncharacterized protein n=1 Tax=Paraburkholderia kururiensis TaxID=984307 RepID=A0ABZ0WMV8_9BURK|nr:hypothetical protein [Paraburkholderia kururiensis]WQD78714.1 hypothetical protein U0042_03110 [Paraburkholderia kururiensis]
MEHDHVSKLEAKIATLRKAADEFASQDGYDVLFRIIHQPGWTTPAEFAFAVALVDTMAGAANVLVQAKSALVAASRAVGQ